MADSAALLVEEILLFQPIRQSVLSVPFAYGLKELSDSGFIDANVLGFRTLAKQGGSCEPPCLFLFAD